MLLDLLSQSMICSGNFNHLIRVEPAVIIVIMVKIILIILAELIGCIVKYKLLYYVLIPGEGFTVSLILA